MTVRMTGITGLLDTDALVSASMQPYKAKYTTQKQKEQILEWKQDAYRDIMKDANSLYTKYLTSDGSSSLLMSSAYNSVKYTSSNESAVSATTATGASIDNYKVSVSQLATASTATLGNDTYTKSFTIMDAGGNSINIDPTSLSGWSAMTNDDKGTAVANLINSSLKSNSGLKASYSSYAGGLVLQTTSLGSNASFSVNGNFGGTTTTNTYKNGKDLEAIVTNSSGKPYTISGVHSNSATIDNVTFNFKDVTNSSTTSSKYITSASINTVLGDHIKSVIAGTGADAGKTLYTLDDGSNTVIKMDSDGKIENLSSSVQFTNSDGSTTTIGTDNKVTTQTANNNQVTLTGSKDVSGVKDRIKSFVNDYNALLGKINTKLYEKYDKTYQPLTDDEKKSMTDTQITQWETKAKTGLLHNDSYLDELAQSMKDAMSGITGDKMVSSSGLTLEKMGIKPVEDYSSQNGLYEVDDAALTTALENNMDAVQELFSKNTGTVSSSGLGKQLGDVMWNQVKKTDSTFDSLAGTENGKNALTNDLSKQITDMKKKIAEMKTDLDDRENTLYTKYAKMESALSKLQSQQSSLSSYFSSGSQG